MSFDLVPRRYLSFPSLSSFWGEEDDMNSITNTNTGLSISEDETHVYVEASVPGIRPENIEVTYQDGYVWIRGEVKEEEKDKKRKYYRQSSQSYSYRVAIPGDINQNAEPEATYAHGVMKVAFAKSPVSQPRKIKVKQAEEKTK